MGKIKLSARIFGAGLIVAGAAFSVSSAQSAYPERVLMRRQSLLGNIFSLWPFSKTPAPASYGASPSVRGGYAVPVAQPGVAGPFTGGANPPRGGVSSGGACASCNTGYVLENGNCVASGSGSGGANCSEVSLSACNATQGCKECFVGSGYYCASASLPEAECRRRCLSFDSKIATPTGNKAVIDLKRGDIIWTADTAGNRVVRPLIRVSRVPAANHHVARLVLADGRALDVSALHPTADGRTVGDLRTGNAYDGSVVKSAVLKPYEGAATYDILPAGDTGYYWANGILMGSTLKE